MSVRPRQPMRMLTSVSESRATECAVLVAFSPATSIDQWEKSEVFCSLFACVQAPSSFDFDRFIRVSKIFPRFQIHSIGSGKMVTYSIKDLMGLCSDYALDAQIQKILFSLDLWVPQSCSSMISPLAASAHPTDRANFSRKFILIMWPNNDMLRVWFPDSIAPGSWLDHLKSSPIKRASLRRSPSRNDGTINHSNVNTRLRRTLASRSMSAEVFHSSIDMGSQVSAWKNEWVRSHLKRKPSDLLEHTHRARDSTKSTATTPSASLNKKSSSGSINPDDASQAGHIQMKLLPIMEGGENDDQQNRKDASIKATTISWTPTEYVHTLACFCFDQKFSFLPSLKQRSNDRQWSNSSDWCAIWTERSSWFRSENGSLRECGRHQSSPDSEKFE